MQKKNNKSKLHQASIFSLFFPTNSPYLTPIGSDKSSNQFSESESGSETVGRDEHFGFDPFDGICLINPDFKNKRGRAKLQTCIMVYEIVIQSFGHLGIQLWIELKSA